MEIDRHQTTVGVLCERYLRKESEAMILLNTLMIYAADFSMIDEKRENKDFDYAEEMQELIHGMKNLNHDLERNDLLLMGNYAKNYEKENV